MTRSRNIRLYRACQRCRTRKLKCDQTTSPDGCKSQCFECIRAGGTCVLADSRRGGNFSRMRQAKRVQKSAPPSDRVETDYAHTNEEIVAQEKRSEDPIYAELTNPGDALQILARLAALDHPIPRVPSPEHRSSAILPTSNSNITHIGAVQRPLLQPTLSETETLVIGVLGADTTKHLLDYYSANYHPFSPLAPKSLLAISDVRKTAVDEPFLLTVVLTIASKDDTAYREIHQHCWQYMKRHLLEALLAAPRTLNVATVEGLLLLAEWVPYSQMETSPHSQMPSGNLTVVEDNMAWSLIGQAVRHAYLLRLDKASFREKVDGEPNELENRKRLAWIFVYIADRQISVRMGQSFWSRGPSLSTRFTANDFPSLQLIADAEHNYALVLQATIELTQLLHNAHDILYSSKERRLQMVRLGDYNRYLDDFRQSFSKWQARWGNLEASPKLKSTLTIFKEYVRLYVTAFSFQSILSRAVQDNRAAGSTPSWPKQAPSLFPQGVMASPDGVYVFESVNSARNILTMACKTDPVAHIRYMPFRFYVYAIYSAVFLYKASVFGVFSLTEHTEIADLVHRFVDLLESASTSDRHIGGRYAELLKRIWLAKNTVLPNDIHSDRHKHPNLTSAWDGEMASGVPFSETMLVPSPEFNLFCPDFSSLESELFDPVAGTFSFYN